MYFFKVYNKKDKKIFIFFLLIALKPEHSYTSLSFTLKIASK
jgi:hypothetical protein